MGCAGARAVEPPPHRNVDNCIVVIPPAYTSGVSSASTAVSSGAPAGALSLVEFARDFEVREALGQGSFGTVHAVTRRLATAMAGEALAAKVVEWTHTAKDPLHLWMAKVEREARVWRLLSESFGVSEHVLRLQEFYVSDVRCVFVMERCDLTLGQHLSSLADFDEAECARHLEQMRRGLAFVHACEVVHRDVKNSNFLVQHGRIRLIDFGLAETLPSGCTLTGFYGTAPFMSPEVVRGEAYGLGVDVWSLGCVAYTLMCGCFPHMPKELNPTAMKEAIARGVPGPCFRPSGTSGPLSPEAVEFLQALLEREPSSRLSSEAVGQLPFLREPRASQSLLQQVHFAGRCGAF